MYHQDPIRIAGPLGRVYSFTRRYHGDNLFEGPRLAFPHDRSYAREHLLRLTRYVKDDPFNYRLLDVWQLVFQKPWTRPRSLFELVTNLTDKIHRGELFVYMEPDPGRDYTSLRKGSASQGEPPFIDIGILKDGVPAQDQPRVSGPVTAKRPASWGDDYTAGLTDSASAIASDIATEQTELYDNTSGWGNVMYPVFKPVENFGSFVGNTVGLMSGLSPNGMNPKVAEYWKGIGDGIRTLGSKIADAVGGDGRAAGEITPAVASMLVTKKVPDASLLKPRRGSLRGEPEHPHPNANADMVRSLLRQNESAELLSNRGLNVTHLPNTGRKGGNPDLDIDGRPADVYSPKSKNPNTIWDNMVHKIDHQAADIVLNLSDSPLSSNDMMNFIDTKPVSGLENLYLIDGEDVLLKRY